MHPTRKAPFTSPTESMALSQGSNNAKRAYFLQPQSPRQSRTHLHRKPKAFVHIMFTFTFGITVLTLLFCMSLYWTQAKYASDLSARIQQDEDSLSSYTSKLLTKESSLLEQSIRNSFFSASGSLSSRLLSAGDTKTDGMDRQHGSTGSAGLYHDAWYIDDKPDFKAFDIIYEDDRIRSLTQQYKAGTLKSYQPYAVHEKTHDRASTLDKNLTANHPILTTLRTVRDMQNHFNPVCHRYKFPNITLFPTMSIIIPMQNERAGLLSLTVHSLLARTPPTILHEIIIVDDNGDHHERADEVDDEVELKALEDLHPTKIKYIRNERRLGCAGSRLTAIKAATGEVIVVLDSHVEMYSSTWAQHLLLPILENPRTLAMQTLDIIDDRPGHSRNQGTAVQNYGFVSERFMFSYVPDRFADTPGSKETPSRREPFETPFAPGSLFAIRREEFWRLGGYDQGLLVWGGENIELVMKVWRCGYDDPTKPAGRVVVVPCSRVGHVYRVHIKETGRWPPRIPEYIRKKYQIDVAGKWHVNGGKADHFTRLVERNNMRVFRVWLGSSSFARNYFYKSFGVNSTDPKDFAPEWATMLRSLDNDTEILRQEAIRDRNKCKSIDWFDRHVVYRLVGRHLPSHDSNMNDISCGQHKAESCGLCPRGHGKLWCNGQCHWCEHGSAKNPIARNQNRSTDNARERFACVPAAEKCAAASTFSSA